MKLQFSNRDGKVQLSEKRKLELRGTVFAF